MEGVYYDPKGNLLGIDEESPLEGFQKNLQKAVTNFQNKMHEQFPAILEEPDVINHPSHYESGRFECIDVMEETQGTEAVKDFCLCNAFKYLYRHRNKNGLEDVKKANWYLNKYIELSERKNNESK